MATQNKVFVSPGVYTSELDLTFVAQSVGVTTLGVVGETLQGPAFEPILVSNYDEYKTYFGATSPEKDGAGNPKYELPYVAKSYLQQSNQLFVTRVLGLTGYKAGKTYAIKTIATSGNTGFDGIVVASFRSRGFYSGQTLTFEVTGNTQFAIATGTTLQSNPLAEFDIHVTGKTGGSKVFTCTMDQTSSKYITKVLGTGVYDMNHADFPIYVNEAYPNLLLSLYRQGYISGLSINEVVNSEGDNFLNQWDTTSSPMVVSEVRGGKVQDLFNVISIADGDAANKQIKITIQNIDVNTGEFDLVVRDFYDTDDNIVILERFSRCSMNPDVPGYIAVKVGTSDGEYTLNSKYIMLNMALNAPTDAIPSGFKGFNVSDIGHKVGSVVYKTSYFNAGETIYVDPVTMEDVTSNGDKVRKVMLGLSTQDTFKYDADLFKYKGNSTTVTPGFHLSTNASSITGDTETGYAFYTTSYDLEGQTGDSTSNPLLNINYRKFTFTVAGGFDGWDIYRNVKTNTDQYIYGKSTYVSGTTVGVFNSDVPNSDYYAYLKGIQTFANPEAVNINLFATPGLDFLNNSSLVSQAIDMIENERADSLYIIGAPNEMDAQSAVDDLDTASIDSNYSATYWPWIQVRDTDNATQLYIPPTGEVCKNIALTDNVAYPWFAPAGYSRGLVNAIKAQKKLTLDDRDLLYKNRINPIATFSDTGTIIWGNKTLQVKESALDRINVRRLLLQARKLISAVAVRLLFEQNDDQVRQEFLRLVNPILDSIKKERGLYDFKVTVSSDPADIDANTMRGKIYVKPTRALEFIDLEFVITPTGASFENI